MIHYVYYVQYTQAEKLQAVLQQAVTGRTSQTTAANVAPGQTATTLNSVATPIAGQPLITPGNTFGNPQSNPVQRPLVNAPGAGIADDKCIYSYIPAIIEFYTGRVPILANVETHNCREPEALKYVLDHLAELVVKETHGSGGYGMLVGPAASKAEIEAFRAKLKANPSNYIAQPTLALSTCPTLVDSGVAPRHLDLRPFVLIGDQVRLVPGGLTRVALRNGSLVVNSSQGGGTKDTWVLQD